MIKVNIAKAEQAREKDYSTPFPQGWHCFLCQEVEVKTSQNGNEYVKMTLYCADQKRKLWHNLNVQSEQEYSQKLVKDCLKVCGIDVSKDNFDFNENDLIGSSFKAKVKNVSNTYNGEKKIQSNLSEFRDIDDPIQTTKADFPPEMDSDSETDDGIPF